MTAVTLAELRFDELIDDARRSNASDVHIAAGTPPAFRIDGSIEGRGEAFSPAEIERTLEALLPAHERSGFERDGDVSVSARRAGGTLRVHAYRTRGGCALAVRLLPVEVPTLESLGLPPVVRSLASSSRGLILFAGPTGSGKTTALAATVDRINRTFERHILTIEEPVEYVYTNVKSRITQREVGRDCNSFSGGVRGALRSDPDVIVIGEMRDAQTMQAALIAAETGHLVFSTIHTGDAPQTVDRILDACADRGDVRIQLAQSLVAVVCLRLVNRGSGAGRVAAAEVLIVTDAARTLVRERKTHQLRNLIATGRESGMQTLEHHLGELILRREVSAPDAVRAAPRPHEIVVPDFA